MVYEPDKVRIAEIEQNTKIRLATMVKAVAHFILAITGYLCGKYDIITLYRLEYIGC